MRGLLSRVRCLRRSHPGKRRLPRRSPVEWGLWTTCKDQWSGSCRADERSTSSRVRPGLGQEDEGAFVVIDVESGDYAIAADEEEAFARVEARHQGAVFFFSRVGPGGESVPAHRIGAHS